jgi:beta-xylosidase
MHIRRASSLGVFFFMMFVSVHGQQSSKQAPTSGNPIFTGWYADPEAAVFEKQYWVFPTYSAKYEQQVFMDAFSSRDFITWKKHAHIIDTAAIKWAHKAMWAPAVLQKGKKYFLFFAANDIQKESELGGIGIAVSDNPQGPYADYLGKPLLNKIVNKAQPIDQFVFQDKDGQYYMIYGGWGHCNIVKLNHDFTGFTPFENGEIFKEITPQDYVEGPIMFIRKNKYYFMWSEGGWGGPNYRVAYAMGDSPFGPWKRIGTVLQQDAAIATGAGHHSVIQVPGTDEWKIVYHRRPLGETHANSRVTCIDDMHFDEQGFILPVKISQEGVKQQKIK